MMFPDRPDSDSLYVFVYGTLKRGFPNHRLIQEYKGQYIGPATLTGAMLGDMGGIPGMMHGSGKVYGEVFRFIDIETALRRLDMLEGYSKHEPDFCMYRRELVQVVMDERGPAARRRVIGAWTYFIHNIRYVERAQQHPIQSGVFEKPDWM